MIALFLLPISVAAQDKSTNSAPQKTELLSPSDWTRAFNRAKAAQPDFQVESVAEFKAITNHYLSTIADGEIVNRFHLRSGELIHCVAIHTQRSFSQQGATRGAILPPQPVTPKTATEDIPQTTAGSFGLDLTLDDDGNIRQCPEGSFPRLIPNLQELYRFSSLTDFFRKNPHQAEASRASVDGEVLTNIEVIVMVKAGLPRSLIVAKIRVSKTKFNTKSRELIRLRQARVPAEIINAMVKASRRIHRSNVYELCYEKAWMGA